MTHVLKIKKYGHKLSVQKKYIYVLCVANDIRKFILYISFHLFFSTSKLFEYVTPLLLFAGFWSVS